MSAVYIIALLILTAAGYWLGRARGVSLRKDETKVHSLPVYHGSYVALSAAIPMVIVFALWSALAPRLIENRAIAELPVAMQSTDGLTRATVMRDIANATRSSALAEQANPKFATPPKFHKACAAQVIGCGWSLA